MQRSFLFLISALVLFVWGCGSSVPTLATVGAETITVPEFEKSYAKNNGGPDSAANSTLAEREAFLDLLLKFRLKVLEAKNRGIDEDPAIQDEILGYELSVAETYLIEKEIIEPNLRMLYERKKEELRASHILVRTTPSSPPEDTLKAYQKAMEVIAQVPTTDFDTLAARYSEEPNAAASHGDLGYFSVGRMVPEFEDVVYSLQAGEYTKIPVRTRFGYHVVKVRERHENKGPVRISFIILNYSAGGDTAAVQDSAWMLYRRLESGENFAVLATKYSHDFSSGYRGGDVGFYEKDRLPAPIAEVVTHTPKDSVSKPFFFQNGVYIFKVTDLKGLPSYEEAEKDLRKMYQQMRYEQDLDTYIKRLEQRYAYRFNDDVREAFEHGLRDTSITPGDSAWDNLTDGQLRTRNLISFDGGNVTVGDALKVIGKKAEFQDIPLTPTGINHMIDQLGRQFLFLYHAQHGSPFREDFTSLMDEYRNGILLYQIEQDEIWNRIQVNDSVLQAYYEPRKETYRMPPRVNVAEIYVTSDSLAQVASDRIEQGEEFLDVAEDMTMRAGYRDKKGVWGYQPSTMNDMTRRASAMEVGGVSSPYRNGAGWSIIKVLEKDSARVKTFEEASLEVTSEYQEYAAKKREKEWVDSLRAKYGVTVDRDQLAKAFGREERASK